VALTRFHMKYTGSVSSTDATTLCGTLASSWETRMAPNTGTNYTLIATQVLDLGSNTGVNVIVPVSHVGTNAAAGVPAGVAFVMSAHVAKRYRGGHSRVYIPGMAQTDLSDTNTWTVAFQATVSTAWTGMLSDFMSSPPAGVSALSQVTVHQYSSNKADFPDGVPSGNPPWPLADPSTIPITGWSANPQVGSQRRRNQQG
jgi:hypothetical protein